MPISIKDSGGGDRRTLDAVYAAVKEQNEHLKRVEQHLIRLDQAIERVLITVRGLRR